MKSLFLLTIFLMLIQSGMTTGQKRQNESSQNRAVTVRLATAPEIEALTRLWINGFENANPGMKAELLPFSSANEADIQFVTASSLPSVNEATLWKMVVGRDVIVPVIWESNLYADAVCRTGISPEKFAEIMTAEGNYTWGKLLGNPSTVPVTVLVPADNSIGSYVARFANTDVNGLYVSSASSMADFMTVIRTDPGTIGFCRLADITEKNSQAFVPGYRIIPIDMNNNGQSDYFEQFYGSFSSFSRGVYIGKYPKALYTNIFALASSQPAAGAVSDLLKYILVDGQPTVAASGYTALAEGEGLIRKEMLSGNEKIVTAGKDGPPLLSGALRIMALIIAASLFAYIIYRFTRSGVKTSYVGESMHREGFSEKSLIIPAGILFGRSHIWAFMEKDGAVRVGVDDFLQHVTGAITRVRMKSPGEKINKGDNILSLVQKGKQLDIPSPLSGTITSINEKLSGNTGIINDSPYNDGWIYTIEPDNWIQDSRMMAMAGRYVDWIKQEFAQVKDFIASLPGISSDRYANVVLQDGGELKDGLLEEFGPDIWEEYQEEFLK